MLLTIPNRLGVDNRTRLLETIAGEITRAIGWSQVTARAAVPEAPALDPPRVRGPDRAPRSGVGDASERIHTGRL